MRPLPARRQRHTVAAVILRVTDDAPRAPVRPDACTPEALITDPL